ncbi:hypothetical protein [Myxococcus xanthus]|uniref:hypothetical protein n=1 Tax=Myxococcus xanthus TaxID=34 RepID=UPI001127EC42|nr:hypothetical protein [Myxococcus xanthus]
MPKLSNVLSLWCLLAVAMLGCSSSATGAAGRRDAYAMATCTDTVTCCIQRNPGMPEACGLTAGEAASHMAGVKMAMEAADDASAESDDSHNAALPEWKRRCIRNYGDCQDDGWTGSCYDCLRYCEGQQEWPTDQCFRPKKKRMR